MNAPRQLGTPEETFEDLSQQFDLSEPAKLHILKQGCKTLFDFRFMVNDENEVKTVFIDPLRELEGARLQTARLRHAWTACNKALIDSQQVQIVPNRCPLKMRTRCCPLMNSKISRPCGSSGTT